MTEFPNFSMTRLISRGGFEYSVANFLSARNRAAKPYTLLLRRLAVNCQFLQVYVESWTLGGNEISCLKTALIRDGF
jgi:hypothetical protein